MFVTCLEIENTCNTIINNQLSTLEDGRAEKYMYSDYLADWYRQHIAISMVQKFQQRTLPIEKCVMSITTHKKTKKLENTSVADLPASRQVMFLGHIFIDLTHKNELFEQINNWTRFSCSAIYGMPISV